MAVQKFISITKKNNAVRVVTTGCESCDTCNATDYELSTAQLVSWLIDFHEQIIVENDNDERLTLKLQGKFSR